MEPVTVSCAGRTPREINGEIRALIAQGHREIVVAEPQGCHNLGVATLEPVHLRFEGSVGYYCVGMSDGVIATIAGSAGWGLAECLVDGLVVVEGSVGNGAAASQRGGIIAIRGDAGARAGVSMKGGTLIIEGDCGTMAGFMSQKGTIIICGDAGDALADSMYEGVLYVGGEIASLGNDALIHEPTAEDIAYLQGTLRPLEIDSARDWKRVVAGRKLWTFDRSEALWREAL